MQFLRDYPRCLCHQNHQLMEWIPLGLQWQSFVWGLFKVRISIPARIAKVAAQENAHLLQRRALLFAVAGLPRPAYASLYSPSCTSWRTLIIWLLSLLQRISSDRDCVSLGRNGSYLRDISVSRKQVVSIRMWAAVMQPWEYKTRIPLSQVQMDT